MGLRPQLGVLPLHPVLSLVTIAIKSYKANAGESIPHPRHSRHSALLKSGIIEPRPVFMPRSSNARHSVQPDSCGLPETPKLLFAHYSPICRQPSERLLRHPKALVHLRDQSQVQLPHGQTDEQETPVPPRARRYEPERPPLRS